MKESTWGTLLHNRFPIDQVLSCIYVLLFTCKGRGSHTYRADRAINGSRYWYPFGDRDSISCNSARLPNRISVNNEGPWWITLLLGTCRMDRSQQILCFLTKLDSIALPRFALDWFRFRATTMLLRAMIRTNQLRCGLTPWPSRMASMHSTPNWAVRRAIVALLMTLLTVQFVALNDWRGQGNINDCGTRVFSKHHTAWDY